MRLRRALPLSLLAALPLIGAAHTACGGKKGAIMLAITTDMKAPKDVNVVSVHIQTGSAVKHNFIGRVTPEGEVLLPATLAIAEPDDPNQSIRIRVIAFQETKPRVLRDVRTTVPRDGRIALLRLPLAFVNDGVSISGTLPAKFLPARADGRPSPAQDGGASGGIGLGGSEEYNPYDPTQGLSPGCADPDQTYIDGACKDSFIDSATLPDYSEEAVFGQGGLGACFDLKKCFAGATPAGAAGNAGTPDAGVVPAVDAGRGEGDSPQPLPKNVNPLADRLDLGTCRLTLDGGRDVSKLNVAMVTKDTGECLEPGRCFIPIDRGDQGFRVEGGTAVDRPTGEEGQPGAGATVILPQVVCTLVGRGAAQIYTAFNACASKTAANPICQGTGGGTTTPPADASVEQGEAQLVVAENSPTDLAFPTQAGARDSVYFAGFQGPAFARLSSPGRVGITGIPAEAHPWLVTPRRTDALAGGEVFFTNAFTRIAHRAQADQTTALQPVTVATGPVNDATTSDDTEATIYFATGERGSGGLYYKRASDPAPIPAPGTPFGGLTSVVFVRVNSVPTVIAANDLGRFFACPTEGDGSITTCGTPSTLVDGARIDAAVVSPNGTSGFFTARPGGLYRLDASVSLQATKISGDDIAGLQGEQYFRRRIATDGTCVYYATSAGDVKWVTASGASSGVLASVSASAGSGGVLAVALGPDGKVYFARHAPLSSGGGIYRVSKPSACGGSAGAGSGGIVDGGN